MASAMATPCPGSPWVTEGRSLFPDDAPDAFDPSLPRRFAPGLEMLRRLFRHEVRDLENIPASGPALLVFNHGPFPVDAVVFQIYRLRFPVAAKPSAEAEAKAEPPK